MRGKTSTFERRVELEKDATFLVLGEEEGS